MFEKRDHHSVPLAFLDLCEPPFSLTCSSDCSSFRDSFGAFIFDDGPSTARPVCHHLTCLGLATTSRLERLRGRPRALPTRLIAPPLCRAGPCHLEYTKCPQDPIPSFSFPRPRSKLSKTSSPAFRQGWLVPSSPSKRDYAVTLTKERGLHTSRITMRLDTIIPKATCHTAVIWFEGGAKHVLVEDDLEFRTRAQDTFSGLHVLIHLNGFLKSESTLRASIPLVSSPPNLFKAPTRCSSVSLGLQTSRPYRGAGRVSTVCWAVRQESVG